MEQRALRLMAAFAATIVSASGPASSGDWESSSNAYYTNGFPFNGPNGGSSNFGNNYFNNGPYSSWPPATFDPSEFAASVLGMDPSRAQRFIVIHGVLASIAFVALLPLGAILIRVVPSKSAWLAHAVTQTVGYATYIAAAGIGIYLVSTIRLPFPEPGTSLLELQSINYHFIIGLVVLVVLLFQPLTGVVHHIKYKRNSAAASRRAASAAARTAAAANYDSDRTVTSSSSPSPPPGGSKDEREYNNNGANGSGTYTPRTAWSHVHIWLGRLAITLGIINGGLGLHISGGTTNYIIAYSVIAGVVWLVWLAAVVYGEVSRMKARRAERRKPRDMVVTPGTYTGGNVYGGAFGGGGGGGARQQQQQQPQYPRGDGDI
ncbi:uncharacterized protein B0I36DRAFT_83711 [Microdochium trichocladiopsis]|uniref:Cytochrome b561 domain-containing protein n=1 Tax=Microdochium trichocladiopsis TaxID=1682393 RepID=A0A9P8YDA3_9PEZI|nr:uncharacterized protein B0I36DRAFT_83711 [Microdochium trichocladiopsis]KAH7034737.1 hypothetical protein B0I36DRAFT_83711 [Microdochium trichocladiopsis]